MTTVYAYTSTGKVASVTDALGGVKAYEYDLLGRLTREENELGEATTYSYDALGRVLSAADPLGHADLFTYDALGRIVAAEDKKSNVLPVRQALEGYIMMNYKNLIVIIWLNILSLALLLGCCKSDHTTSFTIKDAFASTKAIPTHSSGIATSQNTKLETLISNTPICTSEVNFDENDMVQGSYLQSDIQNEFCDKSQFEDFGRTEESILETYLFEKSFEGRMCQIQAYAFFNAYINADLNSARDMLADPNDKEILSLFPDIKGSMDDIAYLIIKNHNFYRENEAERFGPTGETYAVTYEIAYKPDKWISDADFYLYINMEYIGKEWKVCCFSIEP